MFWLPGKNEPIQIVIDLLHMEQMIYIIISYYLLTIINIIFSPVLQVIMIRLECWHFSCQLTDSLEYNNCWLHFGLWLYSKLYSTYCM